MLTRHPNTQVQNMSSPGLMDTSVLDKMWSVISNFGFSLLDIAFTNEISITLLEIQRGGISKSRKYPCGFDVYISEFASVRHLWERTEDVNLKEMNCKTGCPGSSLRAVHPQGKFSLLETNLKQKTENLQTQAVYSLFVSIELVT